MSKSAFNIPLPTSNIPEDASQVVASDYIGISEGNNTYSIKNVPYVVLSNIPNGPIVKNYIEFLYQVIYNVMYTNYSYIPYMRHLDKSLDSILFDLMVEYKKDEIEQLLSKKFRNTSLAFLGSTYEMDREKRTLKISCRLKYEGIIVNAQITRNVEEANSQTMLEVTIE
jgi:hypothetical protein